MNESTIGINIAKLRKEKGITQEALAEVVGVTGQAVSKWESGSSPDTTLLPIIAEYFGVSIDRLFGRDTRNFADLKSDVANYISNLPTKERLKKAFDFCFIMESALMGIPTERYDKTVDEIWKDGLKYSQHLSSEGIASLGLDEALRYFLIMPEPEKGWSQRLHYKEEYSQLFSFLADIDMLKILFFLYSRDNDKTFTTKLFEKEFNISSDEATSILNKLINYKLVSSTEIELDDELKIAYTFNPNFAFVAFLTFAEELIERHNYFYNTAHNRGNKPYLSV